MMDEETPAPIEIPLAQLSPAALRGVIEAYVLREGTEYGARDHSLEEKVAAVTRQLERGSARIMFMPGINAVEIVPLE